MKIRGADAKSRKKAVLNDAEVLELIRLLPETWANVIKICRVFGVRSWEVGFITQAINDDGEPQLRVTKGKTYNTRGHTFRQYLDRHPYWAALVKANPGLSPYSLRHGYAYRGALAGIPLRQLAASMGHDVRTHMKHYGQWTDEAGLDAAFGAANAKLTASPTQRQQQMQQQQ